MSINLTNNAKNKIDSIMKDAESGTCFRIGLRVGGCNGFEYTFDISYYDEDSDEIILDNKMYGVIVNHKAYPFLMGATVDYVDTIAKSEFVVDNPNFQNMCGCGKSVS